MAAIQTGPMAGEMPWVPDVQPGDLQWPKRTIYGGVATWSSHKGRHQPCGICVEVIHEKRTGGAHPAPATMRRKGPNGDTYVCNRHGIEWKRRDAEIKAKVEQMRADAIMRGRAIPTQRRGR